MRLLIERTLFGSLVEIKQREIARGVSIVCTGRVCMCKDEMIYKQIKRWKEIGKIGRFKKKTTWLVLPQVVDELAKVGEHAMERNIRIISSLSCDVMTVLFKLVLQTSRSMHMLPYQHLENHVKNWSWLALYFQTSLRACLRGGGGPQVDEVTRLTLVEK